MASHTGQPRSALRNGSSTLLNLRRKNNDESTLGSGPSTSVSEPPPSPHQAYFDKYPKRAERIRGREEESGKHVTIEFPTIPERKSASRHGLRDWRVVQAHLEPRVAPRPKRKDKEREKIRDPDDMVIVSLSSPSLSPSPSTAPLPSTRSADGHESYAWPSRDHKTNSQNSRFDPAYSRHVPTSPSLASGFRSSLISSAGTLTSSAATEPGALTPPRTPTSPHEPVVIASSSVEAMDALIDSMGSGVSLDSMSFLSPALRRNSRFGYPLYQPPLPTPPEGVKLGIVDDASGEKWRSKLGKSPRRAEKRPERSRAKDPEEWSQYDPHEEDVDDTETEAESSLFPMRRTPTTSISNGSTAELGRESGSSFGSLPPTRTGTPSTAASSRTGTPAPGSLRSDKPSSAPSSSSSTPTPTPAPDAPPIRVKSDEEIEADERADVTSPLVPPTRARQRSGVSARSVRSARNASSIRSGISGRTISTSSTGSSVYKARLHHQSSGGIARSPGLWDLSNPSTTELMETSETMDAIIRNHVTRNGEQRATVPSIDDIIKMHAPAVVAANQAASKRSAAGSKILGGSKTAPSTPGHSRAPSRDLAIEDIARSSVDSIADEAQRALEAFQEQVQSQPPLPPLTPRRPSTASGTPRLQHARSFTKGRAHSVQGDTASLSPYVRSPMSDGASICSGNSGNTIVLPPRPGTAVTTPTAGDNTLEMAQYLRSPRLTRLLTLRRPAHAGLTVSLADVGSLTGRPVIVYLGLGCVRYLVALYDEMAEALNLRLICVDRWGLGRTSDVPTEKRGLLEWAGVVEEVADTLGLGRYSVLAHSAGAPYALAGSLKGGERVFGSVHLLAPWVSMAVDGGYKWLKYVPNGLIKTAQAAEWRLQGWMIGKPPTIQYQGIGFDATAPIAQDADPMPGRPSFSSFSEYDELDDFDGRFASRSTLAHGVAEEDKKGKGKDATVKAKSVTGKSSKPDMAVSEFGEAGSSSRSRKGSKSIFGGLFNNTVPKRGQSTPPASYATVKGPKVCTVSAGLEPGADDPEPVTPTSPTTPVPPPMPSTPHSARPPKLKGLRSMSSLKSQAKSEPGKSSSSRERERNIGLGLGMDENDDSKARTQAWASEFGETDKVVGSSSSHRQRRSLSLSARPGIPTSPAPPSPKSPNPPKTVTLASALLQASHAESLKGGTADLLSILERDSKPWGFSYADVRQPVRVWYGDRDDKIGVGSVRWMERVMKSCDVKIVKGAGHSLMTNAEVVVEVLESIAQEWDERS